MEDFVSFRPSWRAFYQRWFIVVLSFLVSLFIAGSRWGGMGRGEWTLGSLAFSAWILLFIVAVGNMVAERYSTLYTIDEEGIEVRKGIISKNVSRVRYEDIREVMFAQSALERILGVGSVSLACSATDRVEIHMTGVRDPEGLVKVIREEVEERAESRE